MELWKNALKLERFIHDFTPEGFKEPIYEFAPFTTISELNYALFEKHARIGDLDNFLKQYSDCTFKNTQIYRFNKPYIISAITEYFNRRVDNESTNAK